MSENSIALFIQIINAHNINCIQLEHDFSNLYKSDLALRCRLYANYDYRVLQNLIIENCGDSEIIKIHDDFNLISYVVKIPPHFASPDGGGHYLFAGPILQSFFAPDDIEKLMKRKHLPSQLTRDMQAYYGNITIPPDCRIFESTLLNVACNLFGQDYKLQFLSKYDESSFESAPDSSLNETPSIAIQSIEERYEVEDQMLDAITNGDQANAIRYHGIFKNFKITPRNANTLLNRKSLLIVFNTLCRKAVQRGHVHPIYIDDLSTRFAIQINGAASMDQLASIESDMIHKYCLLVRNHSMKNYSQIITGCIVYTDLHYAEPLSLAFFADMFHVTKSYLSGLFTKEAGMNLTDYIHSVRIRHALVLLNSTQLPIHVVAASCGYNDMNYFIRMFKRINGISPKQYRVKMSGR